MMKRLPWLRKILYFVCLGAGALILILQAANGYRAQTARGLPITSPQLLFGALVFTGLATGAQMLAWRTLMQGLGVSLGKREVLRGYMLSFLPRYIPGSVWGYLGRNEWFFQEYAVSYAASNLGSILEILALWIDELERKHTSEYRFRSICQARCWPTHSTEARDW